MKFATRLLTFDPAPSDRFTPANTPIYQTATFRQQDATTFGEYDYSRSGNPTRAAVEKQIAALESGSRGFCFSTGLAAITAITRLVSPGKRFLLAMIFMEARTVFSPASWRIVASTCGMWTSAIWMQSLAAPPTTTDLPGDADQSTAADHRYRCGRRHRSSRRSPGVRRQQHDVAVSAAAAGAWRGHRFALRNEIPVRTQ